MTHFFPRTSRRALLSAAICTPLIARGSSAAQTIRMLGWQGLDTPAATKSFREANDADVQMDYIGANDEIFTFLRAGGTSSYDIATPSDGIVLALAGAGLIQPIDVARITNATGLFARFQTPEWCVLDGNVYAIPLIWHTYPMIYNAGLLAEPPAAWTDIVDQSFRRRIVMQDDVLGTFLIWNRALGAADPARVTRAELADTVELLVSMKKNLALDFVGSLNGIAIRLASGGWVSTTGQEIVPLLKGANGADLRLARPAPGDVSVCDSLCIPAAAPNRELAHAFIDHMISATAQAELAGALYRGVVNESAVPQLPEPARLLFDYSDLDAVFAISPLAGFPPLESDGGDIATYLDWVLAWDRIRVAALAPVNPPTPTPVTEPPATIAD
jgi:spermidine/putrescine transport system substrate-binding protein